MSRLFAALLLAFGVVAAPLSAAAAQEARPTAEQQAAIARIQTVLDGLHPQSGDVAIPTAKATLKLGDEFYFLDAAEAKRVLIDIWGNPPSSVEGVLGLIMPAGQSPAGDTWGAVISYVADGYVSDSDAHKIDPEQLLKDLRQGEDADNRQRQAGGFETVHLVGWAQPPGYDAQKHNLIWAKALAFSGMPEQTLNYDVRVLGRGGVLSMNIVSSMSDLATVGAEANRLMATAAFDPGARYEDYRPGVDKKASYGVAGLVAGGVAVAVAKKAGLLGVLFLVLKKGGVVILVALGGAWTWFKRQFAGRKGGDFSTPRAGLSTETRDPVGTGADDVREDLSPYRQPDAPGDKEL